MSDTDHPGPDTGPGARIPDRYWTHNVAYHAELLATARRLAHRTGGTVRALDVGCGDGLLLAGLAEVADEVVGIDAASEMVSAARARLADRPRTTVLHGNVLTDPRLDGRQFDLVTCVATLHHLPLETGLARLASLTAPRGQLRVIGLAADRGVLDRLRAAALVVPVRIASLAHREATGLPIPVRPARESLRQIRAAAAGPLPGALIRRRFYFRYSLTWERPA